MSQRSACWQRSSHSDTLNEQLQTALNSRVIIEQAKGKLAERLGLDMEQAFGLLRDYARARNLRLVELAQSFVSGTGILDSQLKAHAAAVASGAVERRPRRERRPRTRMGAYGHVWMRLAANSYRISAAP